MELADPGRTGEAIRIPRLVRCQPGAG